MKNVIKNKKCSKIIKTKGERLGWGLLKNKEKISLKEVVGEGKLVSCNSVSFNKIL